MNTTNGWNDRTADNALPVTFPAWFSHYHEEEPYLIRRESELPIAGDRPLWQPCDIPAPPKEQTQRERDEAAFKNFCRTDQHFTPCGASWHAALAWERAEIRRLMTDLKPDELHNRLRP